MTNQADNSAFAEVIASSLYSFIAQCWQWNNFPPFGSLVALQANNHITYAVVHQVTTGSMEPNRYPFAYQKTEQELLAEQPQIFSFLKTTFSCVVLGYQQMGKFTYTIAPEPAKIHAFVRQATIEELKIFFAKETYIHLLFGSANEITNLDELLLALLKRQQEHAMLSEKKLHAFIDTYSLLTGNEYRRLKLFLHRAQSIINP